MVILLALGSAVLYALAAVLQFNAVNRVGQEWSLHVRFLAALAHNRKFLAGGALELAGGVGQFFALKYGAVDTVLPILACGFPLSIAINYKWNDEAMPLMESVAIVVASASVAGFLLVRPPGIGTSESYQALAFGTVASMSVGLAAVSIARPLLARFNVAKSVVGACLLGYVAVLERAVGVQWSRRGTAVVVTSWELYALLAVGGLALVVVQSSLQDRVFRSAIALVAVVEPISAVGFAAAIFNEPVFGSDHRLAAIFVSAAIVSLAYLAFRERSAGSRCG